MTKPSSFVSVMPWYITPVDGYFILIPNKQCFVLFGNIEALYFISHGLILFIRTLLDQSGLYQFSKCMFYVLVKYFF